MASMPWLPLATSLSKPPRYGSALCLFHISHVNPDSGGPRDCHGAKPHRYACSQADLRPSHALIRQLLERPTTASTWPRSAPSTSPRSKRRSSRWRRRRFSLCSASITSSLSSLWASRYVVPRAQSLSPDHLMCHCAVACLRAAVHPGPARVRL
jgi:hypothetical protein